MSIRNQDSDFGPEKYHPAMPLATAFGLQDLANKGLDVQVGRYSYGVPWVQWAPGDNKRKLTIGSFNSIADNVRIYVGVQGRHPTDFLSTYPLSMVFGAPGKASHSATVAGNLDVEIGSDVWLGFDCVIFAGCRIGNGAVVGARSIVTKNVPDYAIVGGIPAQVIRYRFKADVIAKLLAIAWWNWPDDKIRKHIDLFYTQDIDTERLNRAHNDP